MLRNYTLQDLKNMRWNLIGIPLTVVLYTVFIRSIPELSTEMIPLAGTVEVSVAVFLAVGMGMGALFLIVMHVLQIREIEFRQKILEQGMPAEAECIAVKEMFGIRYGIQIQYNNVIKTLAKPSRNNLFIKGLFASLEHFNPGDKIPIKLNTDKEGDYIVDELKLREQ